MPFLLLSVLDAIGTGSSRVRVKLPRSTRPKTLFNVAPSELNAAEGIIAPAGIFALTIFLGNEKNMEKILWF